MLLKIIYIIFITSTFNCLSRGIHISEYNETNVILSMNSQLSEMRAKQEHHEKLVDGIAKAMNTQDRQEKFLDDLLKATNVQSIRTELEKQGKFIDGLVKESERQKKDGVEKEAGIKSIREGLDRQGNLINGLVKESERQKKDGVEKQTGIKSIREDLDRQGNLINGLVKESDFQLVRTDISSLRSEQERLGKDIVEKETGIKSIREDLDRQGNLINGLVKESDFQLVRTDISSLRAEQERLGKDGVEKEAGIKSIREGLDRQGNLINGLVKESDFQLVRTDISSLRSEQERLGKDIVEKETGIKSIREDLDRQGNLINGLVKESDFQLVRTDISSLRAEQERLGKDGVEKEAGIKSIREGLDRQGNLINGLVKESERQKKDGVEKEAGIKTIREDLDRQGNLINGLVKESDFQLVRTDISSLRAEQERLGKDGVEKEAGIKSIREGLDRQENLINGLVKESDIQLVRADISSLRSEQERLGKDIVEKETGIKSIREGLDRQENLINGLVKESDFQLVRTDISSLRSEQERLGKDIVEKETGIKSIREDLDRQGNLINGLVKESDIQLVRADISSLRSEQERLGKDGVEKEAGIKSIREGLDRHGKFIDVLVKESERQKKDGEEKEAGMKSIKAQLDQQKNEELVKEKDIQSLKAEQELLRRIIDGLVKKSYLRNCNEAKSSGIHDIVIPNFSSEPFTVACDAETRGGGWTILLRRMDGTVTFNRTWSEYKKGFGELEGEFFLGLDKIHALTAERNQELLVLLEDQDGIEAFENYDTFAIGDEEEQYVLHKLGNASGTARDAIKYNRGMKFSTFDRDNDIDEGNCAKDYTGGWWYCKCLSSKLTGTYNDNNPLKGILWANFRGIRHSLKSGYDDSAKEVNSKPRLYEILFIST